MAVDNDTSPPTLVDLFAGCGGLSLGFENAGFDPVLVSELNISAMSTYLANRVSAHPAGRRQTAITPHSKQSHPNLRTELLTIGDVGDLDDEYLEKIRIAALELPRKGIDVVAGGPPCQGFSGIGHRRTHQVERTQIPSNHLYRQMIRVISRTRPRAFVFENVRGLLSARWTAAGESGEVWRDIRQAFNETLGHDYRIAWDVVHASEYGVPQNRPRVLIVGIRHEYATELALKGDRAIQIGLLPQPIPNSYPSLQDVLGDLVDEEWSPVGTMNQTLKYPLPPMSQYQNVMRQRRADSSEVLDEGADVREHVYSRHSPRVVERFTALLAQDEQAIARLKTKKFAQRPLPRLWGATGPTITVTSLPDDYVHYSQPRTLTVREWARLQGFPDWYIFEGPRTTGGERRAGNPSTGNWSREVPKYTQIGNAVPVRLAEAIARHLRQIIG
jgi:DNA (cytosine-5)-methyltransferase 1